MRKTKTFTLSVAALSWALLASTVFAAVKSHNILLQIRPGYNPSNLVYDKIAHITFNRKKVKGTFEITNDPSSLAQEEVNLHNLKAGKTLTVDASFSDPDGSNQISCSRTWTATAKNNISCSPIEISYQAYDNSCVLVCN